MIILWAQNPLETRFELSDFDKEIIRLRTHIGELEDRLGDAAFDIEPERLDIAKVRKAVAWESWSYDAEEETPLFKRVAQLTAWHIMQLEMGGHIGDCICVPASCSMCHAESLLGVSTISGLSKHPGHKIDTIFRGGAASLEEAIDALRKYEPKADWKGWEPHAPRWRAEAAHALTWLLAYRDEHFPADRSADDGGDGVPVHSSLPPAEPPSPPIPDSSGAEQ